MHTTHGIARTSGRKQSALPSNLWFDFDKMGQVRALPVQARVGLHILALVASTTSSFAQSASEWHVWQDARTFEPYSRTASTITGPITLSGTTDFGVVGNSFSITFGNDDTATLASVGASWRTWDISGQGSQTAEVFKMGSNPSTIMNGNSLCRKVEAGNSLFAVFHEKESFGALLLIMTIFQSANAPFNIDSEGLCGTFNYSAG